MSLFNPLHKPGKTKLGIMNAHDLFHDKMIQVFSRQTGEYLGYVYQGQDQEILQERIEEIEQRQPQRAEKQLSLFDLKLF